MSEPGATYRLQFRGSMTFERAAALAPYLSALGVTHLYASPIFTAAPGSSHGYDVTDYCELDPALGGEAGFRRMAQALKAHGLGLILDIVPNHMAASTANPWWRDVLTWGVESRYARHFDIDWSAGKLLLPALGEPYGEALQAGKFELRADPEAGELLFAYFDLALPLLPASYALVFARGPMLHGLSDTFTTARPESLDAARQALRDAASSPDLHQAIDQCIAAVNHDAALLHALHEAQVWRLAHWRLAREALIYRRFFEIGDLVGARVEDPAVFDDVHALVLDFVKEGLVDGLRIDHVDGLADPKAYLARLGEAGVDYVVVEKILVPDEELRTDWATAGTTGYEAARLITGVQVDGDCREEITRAWTDFTGDDADFRRQVTDAKRTMLTHNLAGELEALTRLALEIARSDIATRDFGRDALRLAIVRIATALPVYRTYVDSTGPTEEDRKLITDTIAAALSDREIEDRRVVDFIGNLLLGEFDRSPAIDEFIRRFQQTTGPLAAKAVEDTVFYRYNRLIALNEVGADPGDFGTTVAEFHRAMTRRAETSPAALSATATHDIKRGEDARARIAVISDCPQAWTDAVQRWHDATADLRTQLPGGPVPDRSLEWLFYQALLGAWPSGISPDDEEALEALADRIDGFMIKAVREAKLRTSWTDPDPAYEEVVSRYVRGVLSPQRRALLSDIAITFRPLELAGLVNSLAQLAIKLTMPGVPDLYQGSELLDLSFVDPDNRRPVDFAMRNGMLREAAGIPGRETLSRWSEGLTKLWLLARLLDLRRRHSSLFSRGRYVPLRAEGPAAQHVVAFARELRGDAIITIVPRLPLRLLDGEEIPCLSESALADTQIRLPPDLVFDQFRNHDGISVAGGPTVSIHNLLATFPAAILTSND